MWILNSILINQSLKSFCTLNWRESSIKWKKTGNQNDFDIIFCLNNENEDNNLLSELQKYKIELNSEIYRPILEKMYNQDGRGQPPIDPVLLFDIHILQAKYNLSNQQVINDIDDHKSFQYFLGYPERLPKKSTLSDFRNRIINSNIVHEIWTFHQDQLDSLTYSIPNEIAIDANFLVAGK
jgi:IS5 family transposase